MTILVAGVVQMRHNLPIRRMFRSGDRLTKDDLDAGEMYQFQINLGYLGTTWWCWGDLESDLKYKKLSAWQEGNQM